MSIPSIVTAVGIVLFLIGLVWAIVESVRRRGDDTTPSIATLWPGGILMCVGIAAAVVGSLLG